MTRRTRVDCLTLGILGCVVLIAVLVLGGCVPPGRRTAITVAGSTSVQPFAEILAEEFTSARGSVIVNVQGGGSSTGYRAASTGAAQIGMLSRNLKPDEAGVISTEIATDAIVAIVHSTNPVVALSSSQLRMIFSGVIGNWREVGGHDRPVHVITREEGSGTRGSFDEMIMEGVAVMDSAVVQDSNGSILETVASDPQALGYISLGLVDSRVRAIELDGVRPTPGTAGNGEYRLVRPFLFVTGGQPEGVVKEFIDFVLSERGQSTLETNGLIRAR